MVVVIVSLVAALVSLVVGVGVPLVGPRVGEEVHEQGYCSPSQHNHSPIGQQGCVDRNQAWVESINNSIALFPSKPDVKFEKNSLGSEASSYSMKESSSSKADAIPKRRRERAREEENMVDKGVEELLLDLLCGQGGVSH